MDAVSPSLKSRTAKIVSSCGVPGVYDKDGGDGSKSRPVALPWKLIVAFLVVIGLLYCIMRSEFVAGAGAVSISGSESASAPTAPGGVSLTGITSPVVLAAEFTPDPQQGQQQQLQVATKAAPLQPATDASAASEFAPRHEVPSDQQRPAKEASPTATEPPILAPPPPPPPAALIRMEPRELAQLEAAVKTKIETLRAMKQVHHTVMERNSTAKALIKEAQGMLVWIMLAKYGPGPHYVEIKLQFPESMVREDKGPKEDTLIVELAPIIHVPYSVYFFLEHIVLPFRGGDFHRSAGHVQQAMLYPAEETHKFAWQEYSPSFPHAKYTLGYAGRPSNNKAFYISTANNTRAHGPGSQRSATEADACFGRLVRGLEVLERMKNQPGKAKHGFINPASNYIHIAGMKLLPQDYRSPSMLRGALAAAAPV